jgi:hypothetical protein
LEEKINSGSQRIKKRKLTVKKIEKTSVKNKFKGQFVELSEYKKDPGHLDI